MSPKPPHVHNVADGRQVSRRILQVAHIVEAIFFAAAFALVAASVLLIANTIRLSVFSRRREIEVMKLVGATNWFVRAPFMVEGLLCGLIGSFVAVVLPLLGRAIELPAVLPSLGVGALGSGLTLRRFLRV